jgi:hypothetical protein
VVAFRKQNDPLSGLGIPRSMAGQNPRFTARVLIYVLVEIDGLVTNDNEF